MCKCSSKCNCNITTLTRGVKGDIGLTGPTGPTGPTGANGWLLNGNTEGSEKYFGTNDNFDIPLVTNNVARGVFDKSGNFGFGITSSLGARVHIKGVDATSSNYSLKIVDSASSNLFNVKNDGYINVGLGNVTIGSYVGLSSIGAIFMAQTPTTTNYVLAGTSSGGTFLNGDTISYSINGSVKGVTIAGYTQFTHPFAVGSIVPSGSNAFAVSGESYLRGIGTTSAAYAVKVDNSSAVALLYVRNDGRISAPLVQTGNAGLSAGDLYKDTAANILANTDYVIGMKA